MTAATAAKPSALRELDERSRDIFRRIVDSYVETGEPVGSRTLSRLPGVSLSPASIRNVMADLEDAGLLAAPHTSAGRVPTETGLRLYVSGLLELGDLSAAERERIESQCAAKGRSLAEVLQEASRALSGLTRCVGLVAAPRMERPLRHIEFVPVSPGRALVVLVTEDGLVENRMIDLPLGVPASALVQATNYLAARIAGRTTDEARAAVHRDLETSRAELDALTKQVVAAGLATWTGGDSEPSLIVRGQANLLEDVRAVGDLERIKALFEQLERRESTVRLLDAVGAAEGVQIFIGSANNQFELTGCSMVASPYRDRHGQIIGAIGVIGPTRMNYARIIPLVDYTAHMIGRTLG